MGDQQRGERHFARLTMGMCAGLLVDILIDTMPLGILAGFAIALFFVAPK